MRVMTPPIPSIIADTTVRHARLAARYTALTHTSAERHGMAWHGRCHETIPAGWKKKMVNGVAPADYRELFFDTRQTIPPRLWNKVERGAARSFLRKPFTTLHVRSRPCENAPPPKKTHPTGAVGDPRGGEQEVLAIFPSKDGSVKGCTPAGAT